MALFLNDEEFFEGFLGGSGWILSHYYFKRSQVGNPIIIGISTWMLLWFTRKIGMRIYRKWRENRLDASDGINLHNFTSFSDNKFKLMVFLLLYFAILSYGYSNITEIKLHSSINNKDITLMGTILMLIILIYLK